MKRLFESGEWSVTGEVRGKKDFPAIISVRGRPSDFGSGHVMLAIADGVVTYSGRCYDERKRAFRLGMHVEYQTEDGTLYTYGNVARLDAKVGDRVRVGMPICKAGWERDAVVEVRRNGRRIDVRRVLEEEE